MRRSLLLVLVLLAASGAGCDWLTGSPGESEVLLRFGALADVQYCDCDYSTEYNVDFRASIPKLLRATAMLNEAYDAGDIAFTIHLGDTIDREAASYGPVLAAWGTLNHPAFLVPGNHDLGAFGDYDRAVEALGIESETGRGYYSFQVERAPGWRFLVIDGNDASLTATRGSAEHAHGQALYDAAVQRGADTVWFNGGASEAQLAWLASELEAARAAGERVVAFSHFPLGGTANLNLWNAEEVLDLFRRYGNVAGFYGGHDHRAYTVSGVGVPQIGVPSLLEDTDAGEWGIATIYADGHIAWEGRRRSLVAWPEAGPGRRLWAFVLGHIGLRSLP